MRVIARHEAIHLLFLPPALKGADFSNVRAVVHFILHFSATPSFQRDNTTRVIARHEAIHPFTYGLLRASQ
jgi:hypothetical protein